MTTDRENTKSGSTIDPRKEGALSVSWWKERIDSCDLFDAAILDEKARSGQDETVFVSDYLGKALWITFLIVVISGIVLLVEYLPSVAGAFTSVEKIQNSVGLGWLLRGAHKYGTDLFVILAILRLIRIGWRRAYKFGGELGWVAAIVAVLFGIISGLTGYLLIWNQRIFASGGLSGKGVMDYEQIYPLGGLGIKGWLANWLVEGDGMTQNILTSVFSIHIGLSVIAVLCIIFWRNMKRNQVPIRKNFSMKIPKGLLWYILGLLVLLSLVAAPPLGTVSGTILKPHPILADWFLLGFYEFANMFPSGVLGFIVFVGILIAVFLPWIDRSQKPGPRPSVTALIVAILLTWILLTWKALGLYIPDFWTLITISIIWFVSFAIGIVRENRLRISMKSTGGSEVTGR